MSPSRDLPSGPPFVVRARVISPLAGGGTLDLADGLLGVDAGGRISLVEPTANISAERLDAAVDLRPWVILPGMVDLHAHLPQVPNAGLGFALSLLDWLDRLTFPTERSWSDPAVAERLAPAIFRAFAAAGTTTLLA
jgi:guanine deaminase